MDPDVTLRNALDTVAAYRRGTLRADQTADQLSEQLERLAEWTWNGGYEPRWPQRPLTREEVTELRCAGHRA